MKVECVEIMFGGRGLPICLLGPVCCDCNGFVSLKLADPENPPSDILVRARSPYLEIFTFACVAVRGTPSDAWSCYLTFQARNFHLEVQYNRHGVCSADRDSGRKRAKMLQLFYWDFKGIWNSDVQVCCASRFLQSTSRDSSRGPNDMADGCRRQLLQDKTTKGGNKG